MTLSWMLYALVISSLAALAGTALERAARLLDLEARWVWMTAMLASVAAPFWIRFGAVTASARSATDMDAATDATLALLLPILNSVANPSSPILTRMNDLAGPMWIAASIVITVALLVGTVRLTHSAKRWPRREAGGETVRVSGGFGPALVGLVHPEIVLPHWILGLGRDQLEVVLLHEAEHRRVRDPLVLAGGVAAVLLMPWNPAIWWQLTRMRRAVELDCDRRVLRRGIPRITYGEVLLNVGARAARMPLPVPGLTNPVTLLERRILMITGPAPKGRVRKAAAALAVAGVVIAGACEAPTPPEIAETGGEAAFRMTETAKIKLFQATERAMADSDGKPLIYLDEVRIEYGTITDLDPSDIESVEVIKGSVAIERFGEGATNGVILITRKGSAFEYEMQPRPISDDAGTSAQWKLRQVESKKLNAELAFREAVQTAERAGSAIWTLKETQEAAGN